jgi:hypothetical protein
VDALTPKLFDLLIERVAKFLRYALDFLPSVRAVLAIECEHIDDQKQAEKKHQTKEKLAHPRPLRANCYAAAPLKNSSSRMALVLPTEDD